MTTHGDGIDSTSDGGATPRVPPVQYPGAQPPPDVPPTTPGVLGQYAFAPAPSVLTSTSDERTMAMLCHLLAIFTGFVGPLIVWLIKNRESRYVDAHGRAVLNFYFTYMLVMLGAAVIQIIAIFTMLGAFLICFIYPAMLGYWIFVVVMNIIHCIEASKGNYKPYPMAIPFFRQPV